MLNLVRPRYVCPSTATTSECNSTRSWPMRWGSAQSGVPARERAAAGDRLGRRRYRRTPGGRDGVRRRRRHRRSGRRGPARPPDALRRWDLHRRRHGFRADRRVGRPARGHLPRGPVHRAGRRTGLRHPRGGGAFAHRAAREGCGRSTCSSASSTTSLRPSSTTGCDGGRWFCRSSSRLSRAVRAGGPRAPAPRAGVGMRTTKRVPEPSSGVPGRPCRRATGPPPGRWPAQPGALGAVAAAADEAFEHAVRELGRDPGPGVLDDDHRLAVPGRSGGLTRVPGGVWCTAFSSRLSTSRCSSSRTPAPRPTRRRSTARDARPSGRSPTRPRSGLAQSVGGGSGRAARRPVPAAAGRPPGGASAAPTGAPPRRCRPARPPAPRRAAPGWPGRWSAVSAARARRRRRTPAGDGACLGAPAGRLQGAGASPKRAGQFGDLVLGLGEGDVPAGVPGALDLPGGIGELDDRADRPRRGTGRPAGPGTVPPRTPRSRKNWTRAMVWSRSDMGRA